MTNFDHDDQTNRPVAAGGQAAARRRAHAAEVFADLAGATEETLDTLPPELPVEALVACGNCWLYGGVSSGIELPAWLAAVAARRIATLLDDAAADADRLPETLPDLLPEEAEDLLAGLVHARMDAWAAMLELDDMAERRAEDPGIEALLAAIDMFFTALDRFDRAIFARQAEIGRLTSTHLFANLRAMLATDHRDPLPWWLDGRIEDDAIDTLMEETLRSPPRPWTSAVLLDLATLGGLVQPTYAAAASAATTAPAPAGATLRWHSPDGSLVARFVPPVERQAVPQWIVITFRNVAGEPAFSLVGRRCSFGGVQGVIERRVVAGADSVLVEFPGTTFFGAGSPLGSGDRLALVVGDPGSEWMLQPWR